MGFWLLFWVNRGFSTYFKLLKGCMLSTSWLCETEILNCFYYFLWLLKSRVIKLKFSWTSKRYGDRWKCLQSHFIETIYFKATLNIWVEIRILNDFNMTDWFILFSIQSIQSYIILIFLSFYIQQEVDFCGVTTHRQLCNK